MKVINAIKVFWNLENIVFLFLNISIFLLPFNLKLNSYSILLTSFFWLFYQIKGSKKKLLKPNLKELFILGFPIVLAILGLLLTSNLNNGISYLTKMSSFLIFPLIYGTIPFSEKKYFLVLKVFVFGCLLFFLYEFTIFFYNSESINFKFENNNLLLNLDKFFSKEDIHPTYFSIFLVFSVCICVFFFIRSKNLKEKFLLSFIILLLIVLLLILMAKTPLFSLIFISIIIPTIYFFKNLKRKLLLPYFILLLSIVMLGGYFVIKIPNRMIQEINNYYNYLNDRELKNYYSYNDLSIEYSTFWFEKTNRIVIWRNCFELIKSSPIVGVGTGDVQEELTKVYVKNKELWRMQFFNSHNQYIDYWLRYGILGFLLLIIIMVFYFYNAIIINNDYLYLSFFILICLCFLTENIIQRQWGIVFFSFFNSLMFYKNKFAKSPIVNSNKHSYS